MKRELSNSFILLLIQHSFFARRRGNTSLLVALVGLSVGIFSLIAIIGTMNGMQGLIIAKLIEIESYNYQGTGSMQDMDAIIEPLEASNRIALIVPFVDEFAFLQSDQSSTVLHLRALSAEHANNDSIFLTSLGFTIERNAAVNTRIFSASEVPSSAMPNKVPSSEEDEQAFIPNIIIGWSTSGKLGVNEGDIVSLTIPGQGKGFLPLQTLARIHEIFYSASDYDYQWAFMSLEDYTQLVGNSIDSISYGVRTASNRKVRPFLSTYLDKVSAWQENNSAFYVALKTEKIILILLSAVIFCVIVLHFRFTMLRRVKKKKDDIVSLRTMGSTPKQIAMWFMGETIAIGIIGSIVGLVLGMGYLYLYPHIYEKLIINYGVYISNIATQGGTISMRELLLIFCFTWVALLWSSWSVVQRSIRIAPSKVLRYE